MDSITGLASNFRLLFTSMPPQDEETIELFNRVLKKIKFYGVAIESFSFRVENDHKKFFALDSKGNEICIFQYSKGEKLPKEALVQKFCASLTQEFPAYNWKSISTIRGVELQYEESDFQQDAAYLERLITKINVVCHGKFFMEFTEGYNCKISVHLEKSDPIIFTPFVPFINRKELKKVFVQELAGQYEFRYYTNLLIKKGPLKKYFSDITSWTN